MTLLDLPESGVTLQKPKLVNFFSNRNFEIYYAE